MPKHFASIQLWLFLFAFSSWQLCAAPTQAETDATEAAKGYILQLKAGEFSDAVEKYWDMDEFFSRAMGLTYLELPAKEKEATKRALTKYITAPFSEKSVSSLFRSIEILQTQTRVFSDTQIAVRLHVSGNKGRFNGINTLLMQKNGEQWQIIDQSQSSAPSMRASVMVMWAQEGHGFKDTLAVVIDRMADDLAKEAKKRK